MNKILTAGNPVGLGFKTRLAKSLAKAMLSHSFLEKLFRYFVSKPAARKYLKLGAVAIGCAYALREPVIRLAKPDAYQIFVNIAELAGIESYFFGKTGTASVISDLIREGDLCADVGANMGLYTLYMASKTGKNGRVIAFEPQPFYLELLKKSIALNHFESFVEISDAVAWKKTGETLSFYLSTNPNNGGTASLVNHGVYISPNHKIQVQTTTLDDFAAARNLNHFRLIKIDVERSELEVLQGMTNILSEKRADYILLEMFSGSESQKLLEISGYRCFYIKDDQLINAASVKKDLFGDYLFISPKLENPAEFR